MGLFGSSKKKIQLKEMPTTVMLVGVDMIGKIRTFQNVDNNVTMAVNLGYFYGFMKIQLVGLTSMDNVNWIIETSINNLKEAISQKSDLNIFSKLFELAYKNAYQNMKELGNDSNAFNKIGSMYLNELYGEEINDPPAEANATRQILNLYGMISRFTSNIKIVK